MPIDLMDTFPARDIPIREGLIKMKLAHARGTTVFLPDILLSNFNGNWKWFQPQFFTACQLSFLDEQAYGQLGVDLNEQLRMLVAFTKDRFVRRFSDGSQLYECKIAAPVQLDNHVAGTCTVSDEHSVVLNLFHHTLPNTVELIRKSGHFRASTWNIQGTRELSNVGYAYFTSLPAVRSDDDLRAIAMASDGKIALCPTNATSRQDVVVIDVYRQSTFDRRATDLPPDFRASLNLVKSAFKWRSGHEEAVFGRADHRVFEAGAGRRCDQGLVPQERV